jgi:hypothetical protein
VMVKYSWGRRLWLELGSCHGESQPRAQKVGNGAGTVSARVLRFETLRSKMGSVGQVEAESGGKDHQIRRPFHLDVLFLRLQKTPGYYDAGRMGACICNSSHLQAICGQRHMPWTDSLCPWRSQNALASLRGYLRTYLIADYWTLCTLL